MKTHRNCCGFDVHKQTIAACLIREDGTGNSGKEKRLSQKPLYKLLAVAHVTDCPRVRQRLRAFNAPRIISAVTAMSEIQVRTIRRQ